MDGERDIIAAWVGREIMPHERAVRSWIARRWGNVVEPDDVIQEAYCRISRLASVDYIENPIGYFRRTAQAVVTDHLRRIGIINFVSLTEIEWMNVKDAEPLVDRMVVADQELKRVTALLSELSDTCREAIRLRRVEGVSQREAARRLGVSEDVIRNHLVRGVKKILQAMAEQDAVMEHPTQERESGPRVESGKHGFR